MKAWRCKRKPTKKILYQWPNLVQVWGPGWVGKGLGRCRSRGLSRLLWRCPISRSSLVALRDEFGMASERNGLGRHPSWRGGRAKGAAGLSGCGKQRRVCPGGASGPPPSSRRLHSPLGREATGACTSRCCPWSACWLGSGTQQSGPSPPLYKIKKTGLNIANLKNSWIMFYQHGCAPWFYNGLLS